MSIAVAERSRDILASQGSRSVNVVVHPSKRSISECVFVLEKPTWRTRGRKYLRSEKSREGSWLRGRCQENKPRKHENKPRLEVNWSRPRPKNQVT